MSSCSVTRMFVVGIGEAVLARDGARFILDALSAITVELPKPQPQLEAGRRENDPWIDRTVLNFSSRRLLIRLLATVLFRILQL